MAITATVNMQLRMVEDQEELLPLIVRNVTYTPADSNVFVAELNITTSETTVDFGDCTPGRVMMLNRDDTNFVSFGFTTADLQGRLLPNGIPSSLDIVSSADLILQADTATCKVLIWAIDTQ